MFSGIKRNTTDALFSDIVRLLANHQCERCKRDFENRRDIFDCSHFYSRRNKRVRWDFDNASALCRGCHNYFGEHPREHTEFVKKKLGEKKFDELTFRANVRELSSFKIDEKGLRIGFKAMLTALKAGKYPTLFKRPETKEGIEGRKSFDFEL